jgi:hypothetical protein
MGMDGEGMISDDDLNSSYKENKQMGSHHEVAY